MKKLLFFVLVSFTGCCSVKAQDTTFAFPSNNYSLASILEIIQIDESTEKIKKEVSSSFIEDAMRVEVVTMKETTFPKDLDSVYGEYIEKQTKSVGRITPNTIAAAIYNMILYHTSVLNTIGNVFYVYGLYVYVLLEDGVWKIFSINQAQMGDSSFYKGTVLLIIYH